MLKQLKPLHKEPSKSSIKHNIFTRLAERPAILASAFLLSILSITIAILNVFGLLGQPKIGFVRSQELVYGYSGMKEAHNKYLEKVQQWQTNKQTLESDYQKTLSKYKEDAPKLSEKEKAQRESSLKQLRENFENYTISINKMTKEEDEKMTQAVLNQINSFVQDYGEKHGYDIILGTKLSGNVLFGNKALDVTDKVLSALNKAYLGEKQ